MKNAKKIFDIGQALMVLGSILYVVELVTIESKALTLAITAIYVVSLAMILVGWLGKRKEEKAEAQGAAQ